MESRLLVRESKEALNKRRERRRKRREGRKERRKEMKRSCYKDTEATLNMPPLTKSWSVCASKYSRTEMNFK